MLLDKPSHSLRIASNINTDLNTWLDANVVLVSPEFLPELNKLPDSMVSFAAAVDEVSNVAHKNIATHALGVRTEI